MTDFLLQLGLSNVLISLALAIIAFLTGTLVRRPQILYLLWLLVLVKLVTPAVVTIPVVSIPDQHDRAVVSMQSYSQAIPSISENKGDAFLSAETWFAVLDHRKKELSLLWLMGSVLVLALSLARVYRFNRLLREESEVAPHELQAETARIAKRLGLKRVPTIYMTSAHLSPMLWWIGGKVRIVIPAALHEQMDARQFQWILAHELAHLRRRDYLVRWIEWLVCVGFWWNPVVWWARHNLRVNEELCCDALVVSSLQLKPQTYADSLLKAVEFIAFPVLRPPVMASEFNSGGLLKRRFTMIASGKLTQSKSRFWQLCIIFFAVVVLPFGLACESKKAPTDPAENTEDVTLAKTSGQLEDARANLRELELQIREAVEAGEMTPEEGRKQMTDAMEAAGISSEQKTDFDLDAIKAELDAAVEAGEITQEQANARFENLLERIKAGEDGRETREVKGDGVDWRAAMATPPEEWSDELKAQIEAAGYDLEEVAEGIRERQQYEETITKLDKDDGIDWRTAKTTPPEEWSDELKAQITAAVVMGNLAIKYPNRKLEWDGENMSVTNFPEANDFVRMHYREGWGL